MTQRAVSTADPRPHVVVVGGGFRDLRAVRVTLVDHRHHHLFQGAWATWTLRRGAPLITGGPRAAPKVSFLPGKG